LYLGFYCLNRPKFNKDLTIYVTGAAPLPFFLR